MLELESYLSGRWVRGTGAGSPLHDPVTGEVVARASSEGLDLPAALDHARRVGGPALRSLGFAERGALLAALSAAIHKVRDELLQVSMRNTGVTRSDAKFDIDGGTATLSAYAELAKSLGNRKWFVDGPSEQLGRNPRFAGAHLKVPLRGVAVHVNAFNFPIWGFAEKLACAFLAGMPVLSKPATATALPTWRAGKAMVDAGVLPPGAWSLLVGSPGDLLTHLGAQDVVAFTGSAETGRKIRSLPNVIEHSVRVNVEADSLNATVVAADVVAGSDCFDLFVRELVREMTQKSGQKCTATRRVFVPRALVETLVETLREKLAEIPMGPPDREGVRMGALATPAQYDDLVRALGRLSKVARPVIGELPPPKASGGAFVAPIVFLCDDPKRSPTVHEVEPFGPVTTIMPYDGSVAEAAELVAAGNGGLVATVYTDELDFARDLLLELAPWHGRVLLGSARIAEHSTGPGLVLPNLVHGGPGRAGGGVELGGLRGLGLYLQTCAVQAARPVLDRLLAD